MTIRKEVLKILQENENTRDNDLELYIIYLEKFCFSDYEKSTLRKILTRAGVNIAGLTRQRAYIQNKLWKFKPLKSTENKRRLKQDNFKKEFN